MRSCSMTKPGGSLVPSQPQERRAPCKAPATAWQPWTPVPQDRRQPEVPGRDAVFVPALTERDGAPAPGQRLRHRSEPQHLKEKAFPFDLDDDSIRTSDV